MKPLILSLNLTFPIQNCTKMKLSMTTKYHIRLYFDMALSAYGGIPLERYTPLLIASLSLAIKVIVIPLSSTKADLSQNSSPSKR